MRAGEVAVEHRALIMPPKPCIWRCGERVLRMAGEARVDAPRATFGCALQPAARCSSALAQCRSMRSASVFTPRSARKLSNGPAIAPTAFCRKPSARATVAALVAPTTATPPTTSEWPFRYLVVECTTMSKPSSSGRWQYGLAKVLSATVRMPRALGERGDRVAGRPAAAADWSASRPRSACVSGVIAASSGAGSVRSTKREAQARRCAGAPVEQPERAAVEVVAGDRRGRRRRAARARWRSPPGRRRRRSLRAALQVGDAALEGAARRVVAAARSRSPCARPGSPGRRSRWRRSAASPRRCRVGRLAGVDGAGGEAPGGWPSVRRRSCRVVAAQVVEQVDAGDQAVGTRRRRRRWRPRRGRTPASSVVQAGRGRAASSSSAVIALAHRSREARRRRRATVEQQVALVDHADQPAARPAPAAARRRPARMRCEGGEQGVVGRRR